MKKLYKFIALALVFLTGLSASAQMQIYQAGAIITEPLPVCFPQNISCPSPQYGVEFIIPVIDRFQCQRLSFYSDGIVGGLYISCNDADSLISVAQCMPSADRFIQCPDPVIIRFIGAVGDSVAVTSYTHPEGCSYLPQSYCPPVGIDQAARDSEPEIFRELYRPHIETTDPQPGVLYFSRTRKILIRN